MTLLAKNGKTTTLLHALPSTPLPLLKAELFRSLQEHADKHSLSIAGELPESPDEIVLGATDDNAAARNWYVLDGQEKNKTTVRDVGLVDGGTIAWKVRGEQFVVEELGAIEDEGEVE